VRAANIPVSTYRVQLNKGFRFVDCRDIIPYLHELGIGYLYSSPRFRARRGSEHGYDVASPSRVNSELGTDEEFDELCEKLKHYGMGMLLDIVPNHMAASHENPWWMDVLENGPSSAYAHYFDIDWHPATSKAAFLQENKVLLPVLSDLYGNVLAKRELSVRLDEGGLFVRYYERRLPLDPKTYGPVLEVCTRRLEQDPGQAAEIEQLLEIVRQMPLRTDLDAESRSRRGEAAREVKRRLFALYRDDLQARLGIDSALREVSGEGAGIELLHRVLDGQAYRLAFWKIAFEEINYRRFFDINDLVCLRVEEAEVFLARHQVILQLIQEEKVAGLRVDHIDGLHDPEGYLARLQAAAGDVARQRPLYVVTEKILGRDEPLSEGWQVCGTTGYDFLNALNGLFIDPDGLRSIETAYARFCGDSTPFAEVCYARNKQVMWKLFAGEVQALGHHLGKLAASDWQARDVPMSELVEALVEVTACLPVYRTYVRGSEISESDRRYLERTLDLARRRTRDVRIGTPAFAFLRRVLLLDPAPSSADLTPEYLRFVMRWQQFTGPVMAKGLEDTAFYVHNSLMSMNEVGGDPLRESPPVDLEGFHRFNQERLRRWPHSMNATSTHDTKRSEDVRARLNVLSELPSEWEKRLLAWRRWNRDRKSEVGGILVPTPSEEVLIYQTLVGAWPLDPRGERGFVTRVRAFLTKAMREAKVHTGWIRQDEAHENAVIRFFDAIMEESPASRFRTGFLRFQKKIAWYGALNSLSQVLLKITSPGVPDFYQGTELWTFSLVDPDNRRPVDFRRRARMLESLRRERTEDMARLLGNLVSTWRDGRIKLFLTDMALDFRRAHAAVFLDGDYLPLNAKGRSKANVCAFARRRDGSWCLCVTPRWTTRLGPPGKPPLGKAVWGNTYLLLPPAAPETWRNVLTGETLRAAPVARGEKALALRSILRLFPVALIESFSPRG
jgi:(1->4)-alpha-D-glucan 1-alpha-D-glucosylmutase